jgi:indolepyruvate ferredoxin oxidoreductase
MDPRFLQEEGVGIFTGNELLVKGAIENRIGLLTGYPGSPVAEVFDAAERIKSLLVEKGIVVQIANNEALSAARLNGAQMEAIRAVTVMKSVGAHVASDALALGNMAGTGPGGAAVAVFGDDTWSEGTQVPADSRFIAKHLYMPVLEPSTYQEVKDWMGAALDLSEETRLYVAYLVTSNQADGGGTVQVHANNFPDLNVQAPVTIDSRTIPVDDRVIIPPSTVIKEDEVVHDRFPSMIRGARAHGLNQIIHSSDQKKALGFVTSSLSYCYLEHAIDILGLSGRFPILKFGLTYPLDTDIISEFFDQVNQFVVVEEKRPFLEEQVKAAVLDLVAARGGAIPVWGKMFPNGQTGFPDTRGLNPSIVIACVARLLDLIDIGEHDRDRVAREVKLIEDTANYELHATARTPSFCPGCPHRDSASVLNRVVDDFMDPEYMKETHDRSEVDLVFHGDIGCYSLLKYKPFDRLMHNLSGMGLGGGTGAGIDPFIRNKQLVFMGDSTFFHSGMTAISDSIKNGQDITYIILDNKTTAMTGHQPTPGVNVDILGQPTFAQDIESIVRGMSAGQGAPVSIVRMDPSESEAYREAVERTLLKDGVKIVIADKECGITSNRRQRNEERAVVQAKGFLPEESHINITPEVCEYCLECTRSTGCSGLTVEDTLHGPKVVTDLSLCVADGACTKVTVPNGDKTCPSFEEVVIRRARAPKVRTESIDLAAIPRPVTEGFDDAWYAYIGGVGGMGVNTISAIISTAGAKEGYTVRFTNKKGLAIRNGAVYSHVSFSKGDRVTSQITPHGHADLLLGLDILEAVRGMDPDGTGRVASPEHTTAVVETGKRETIMTMTGIDDFDTNDLEACIKRYSRADRYFGMDLGEISERFLGNKIYANSILLGAAFQRGALPVTLENLTWAMKVNIRSSELEPNLKAFEMGRKAAIDPAAFDKSAEIVTYLELVEDKAAILGQASGLVDASLFRSLTGLVADWEIGDQTKLKFALGLYDTMQWGGVDYARTYAERIARIHERDTAAQGYEATKALITNLPRVMAYKDEIYVAHLATSEEKLRRDHDRYNIVPDRGDRISYKHIMRPHFEVFGVDIKFDLSPPVWTLNLMKRLRFLRKLLPAWHSEEKAYRDWYVGLADSFDGVDAKRYAAFVLVFKLPDQVRGYREVIWPKMQAAMKTAEYLLEGKGHPVSIDTYAEPEPVREQA